jgi:hypothetical protein
MAASAILSPGIPARALAQMVSGVQDMMRKDRIMILPVYNVGIQRMRMILQHVHFSLVLAIVALVFRI